MFQITNKSAHLFTAKEINKIRDYVTHRVLDEIICAEITETEVVCTTLYGLRSSNLFEIFFPAVSGNIHWEDMPNETKSIHCVGYTKSENYVDMDPNERARISFPFKRTVAKCATCGGTGFITFESHGGNGIGVTNCHCK